MVRRTKGWNLQRNPTLTMLGVGAVTFLIGCIPLLDLFGLLGRPSGWNLPFWLALIFALIFPSAGLFVMFAAASEIFKRYHTVFKNISVFFCVVLLVAFIGGMAIFLTWQTIAPFGESKSEVSAGGIPLPLPASVQSVIDRFFIGLAALIVDGLVVLVIWGAIVGIFKQSNEQP